MPDEKEVVVEWPTFRLKYDAIVQENSGTLNNNVRQTVKFIHVELAL